MADKVHMQDAKNCLYIEIFMKIMFWKHLKWLHPLSVLLGPISLKLIKLLVSESPS